MRRVLVLIWVVAVAATCVAQQLTRDGISETAKHAGVIFRGRVLGVVCEAALVPGELGAIRVTFVVDDAIRGARNGETVTIRQWHSGPDEYRVGESLVLFLYAPSDESGLTSPVGGKLGHHRPSEILPEMLQELREPPAAENATPTEVLPLVAPRRPKKLPPRRDSRPREVYE